MTTPTDDLGSTPVAPEPSRLSDEQRRTARAMAGFGAPRAAIAAYLGTDVSTLGLTLGAELAQAEAEANTKVAQALFVMATKKNNVAAAIFWMKARGGWREKHEIDATITAEVKQQYVIRAPPKCATTEEWLERYAPKDLV